MSETTKPKFGLHTQDPFIFQEMKRDFGISALQMMIPSTDKFGYEVAWASEPDPAWKEDIHAFLHGSLSINLAGNKTWVSTQSQSCLIASLQLAESIGAKGVVVHSGSWLEGSWEEGLERVKRRVARVLEAYKGPVRILFENTAGKGTTMGSDLASYWLMIKSLPEQVGMCIDTAHAWGAGFQPREVEALLDQFGARVGLVHFNTADPEVKLGSGRDRHSVSFQVGATPPEQLKSLFISLSKMGVPMVIERGVDRGEEDEQAEKLAAVRSDLADMASWAKEQSVA